MKMTKIAVAAVMLFIGAGLFAQSSAEQAFGEIYQGLKAQTSSMKIPTTIRKFEQGSYRIIFIDMQLNVTSQVFANYNFASGKTTILKSIRRSRDAELIKNSNCIVVYNYISTDRKVASVVITSSDL